MIVAPIRRLTPNGLRLETWHLRHHDAIVCGRHLDDVRAWTRYDANGLGHTLGLIVGMDGAPCAQCAQKARVLK